MAHLLSAIPADARLFCRVSFLVLLALGVSYETIIVAFFVMLALVAVRPLA